MRTQLALLTAAALLACGPTFAADASAGSNAPTSVTILWPAPPQTPMKRMEQTMEQLQQTSDPATRRALLDQHMAAMDESIGMIRRMDVTTGRRVELLESVLEQMVLHEHIQAGASAAR